jgi:uncharacterized membrane protein
MSETGAAAAPAPRRINWLAWALIASLALNLLFVGAGVTRFLVRESPERVARLTQAQLIPRKFFSELDSARKTELLGVFREMGPAFRDGRRAAREEMASLATALEAEPYDAARVKAVVDSFSARSSDLVAAGGQTALKLIAMLTPEERKFLAQQIRQRGERGRGRGDKRGE